MAIGTVFYDVVHSKVAVMSVLMTVGAERVFRSRVQIIAVAVPTRNIGVHAYQRVIGEVVVESFCLDQREGNRSVTFLANFPELSVMEVSVAGDAVFELHSGELSERLPVSYLAHMAFGAFHFLMGSGKRKLRLVVFELSRGLEAVLVVTGGAILSERSLMRALVTRRAARTQSKICAIPLFEF
jgi:hypothetical protein